MKIFAYGCSFTSYNWPSYANILGLQYEVYNRGASGSGNERIFYCFMQDIKQNNISKNDIVIMQWSGTERFNYLKTNNCWIGEGNVTLHHNNWIFNKIKGWYNQSYEYEKNINLILAAQAILKQLECTSIEMSLYPLPEVDAFFLENDLQGTYQGTYTFTEFTWKTLSDAVYVDSHPTVLQHYDIAKRISDQVNLDLDIDIDQLHQLHNIIDQDHKFDNTYSFKDVQ